MLGPYHVATEVFEGPLDLLLHLVKKHELDILDIPISFVTEKYIEYLQVLERMNLDIAGEYLVMAATLAFIKSRELLPKDPNAELLIDNEEEGPCPREQLIRRLLEYQKYKDAVVKLKDRPVLGRNVWRRGLTQMKTLSAEVDPNVLAPLRAVPAAKLAQVLEKALLRAKVTLAHEVVAEPVSVRDRVYALRQRLATQKQFTFLSCFAVLDPQVVSSRGADQRPRVVPRQEIVVTFLAILEMAKLGMIEITQQAPVSKGTDIANDSIDVAAGDTIETESEIILSMGARYNVDIPDVTFAQKETVPSLWDYQ